MKVPETLHPACTAAGLTPAQTHAILTGTNTNHRAAPALLHAYRNTEMPDLPGPSTPTAYDLGLRLRAATTNGITDRSTHVPAIRPDGDNMLALTREDDQWTLLGTSNRRSVTNVSTPAGITRTLAALTTVPALAVTADHDLHLLLDAVAQLPASDERNHALGVLHTWRSALEHDAVGYAVNVVDLARARYASADPESESSAHHWAELLGIRETTPALEVLSLAWYLRQDMISFGGEAAATDQNYRETWETVHPRRTARESGEAMASSLASRTAWAAWLAAFMTDDLLHSRAALWKGTVASGPIHAVHSGRWQVSGVTAFRYHPGSEVNLRINRGTQRVVTVTDVHVNQDETLTVTLAAPGRGQVITEIDRLVSSPAHARLSAVVPDVARLLIAGKQSLKRRADSSSWLADASKKPAVRDVPWDVLIAASEEA